MLSSRIQRALLGAVGSREADWGLTVLAYALLDLDAGHVAPVVRPTKHKGSPPDRSVTWIMRVRVLVAMDALQKSGMTPAEGNALHQHRISRVADGS